MSGMKKHIVVIGAGPGGLTAAMELAHKGFDVTVVERKDRVGGRNAKMQIDGYTFEIGPTFIMLPDVFRDAFADIGRRVQDYIDLKPLELMYRLNYADGREFPVYFGKDRFMAELSKMFPGEERGYERYLAGQERQYRKLYRCLTVPYLHWYNYLRSKFLAAIPSLRVGKSVHDVLSRYFKSEDLKMALAFQAKYLGMSPWRCPGGFTILSYVEHAYGIYHAMGGVHMVSEGLAKAARDEGAKIRLGASVKRITFEGRRATGVELESGEVMAADAVVMNADFSYGMSTLVPEADRIKKYSDNKLASKDYSCSTFMLYIGLDKKYDLPHHSIFFSADYRKNVEEIYESQTLSDDPSFYVQNASVTDPSLAPPGGSTIYVLVPVANLEGDIDWPASAAAFRDKIISKLEKRAGMSDIRAHIKVIRTITPEGWHDDMGVYRGAVFNLAHSLDQMLYLRPRNKLEGYKNLYVVGGGTHPGSGLPTIVESGRITARLIERDL